MTVKSIAPVASPKHAAFVTTEVTSNWLIITSKLSEPEQPLELSVTVTVYIPLIGAKVHGTPLQT